MSVRLQTAPVKPEIPSAGMRVVELDGPGDCRVAIYTDVTGRVFAKCFNREMGAQVPLLTNRVRGIPGHIPIGEQGRVARVLTRDAVPRIHGGEVHLDFRGRGGGGVFSGAREAAAEVQATIRAAGVEYRGAILTTEESARRMIVTGEDAIKHSLALAGDESRRVLRTGREEAQGLIEIAGSEVRNTSEAVAGQAEAILARAAGETDLLLRSAGREARSTITNGVREMHETARFFGAEARDAIGAAGDEVNGILRAGGGEARALLGSAKLEIQQVIGSGRDAVNDVVRQSLDQLERLTARTLQEAEVRAIGLIREIGRVGEGLIVGFGDQGRMLIRQTGDEIRMTADHLLGQAFAGQAMMIQVAGRQLEVGIRRCGEEVRTTLNHLPITAKLVARAAGEGVIEGVLGALLGTAPVTRLVRDIRDVVYSPEGITVERLLEFITSQDQGHITPTDKVLLYRSAIELFNSLTFCPDTIHRKIAFLMIGQAALADQGLQDMVGPLPRGYSLGGLFREEFHRSLDVIALIPGDDLRIGLIEHRGAALEAILRREAREVVVEFPQIDIDLGDPRDDELRDLEEQLEDEVARAAILRDSVSLKRHVDQTSPVAGASTQEIAPAPALALTHPLEEEIEQLIRENERLNVEVVRAGGSAVRIRGKTGQ